MKRENKGETSIPVQSRISIMDLSELVLFWESQGVYVRSMSQLVGWSMDLCVQMLGNRRIETIMDAHKLLEDRGLYQASMKNRSIKKILTAVAFANSRMEGEDPASYAASRVKQLNNDRSVKPAPEVFSAEPLMDPEEVREIYRKAIARKEEEEGERTQMYSKVQYDENGVSIPVGDRHRNDYTEEDRVEDERRKKEQVERFKGGKKIKVPSSSPATAHESDMPRAKTPAELDKLEQKQKEKDAKQLEEIKKM